MMIDDNFIIASNIFKLAVNAYLLLALDEIKSKELFLFHVSGKENVN